MVIYWYHVLSQHFSIQKFNSTLGLQLKFSLLSRLNSIWFRPWGLTYWTWQLSLSAHGGYRSHKTLAGELADSGESFLNLGASADTAQKRTISKISFNVRRLLILILHCIPLAVPGGARDVLPPTLRPIYFIFIQLLAKILPNNRKIIFRPKLRSCRPRLGNPGWATETALWVNLYPFSLHT